MEIVEGGLPVRNKLNSGLAESLPIARRARLKDLFDTHFSHRDHKGGYLYWKLFLRCPVIMMVQTGEDWF